MYLCDAIAKSRSTENWKIQGKMERKAANLSSNCKTFVRDAVCWRFSRDEIFYPELPETLQHQPGLKLGQWAGFFSLGEQRTPLGIRTNLLCGVSVLFILPAPCASCRSSFLQLWEALVNWYTDRKWEEQDQCKQLHEDTARGTRFSSISLDRDTLGNRKKTLQYRILARLRRCSGIKYHPPGQVLSTYIVCLCACVCLVRT